MLIHLGYIKRGTVGDGCTVHVGWDIDVLPKVGETVFLPNHLAEIIRTFHPEGQVIPALATKRFVVIGVEHKWDRMMAPLYHVLISTLQEKS